MRLPLSARAILTIASVILSIVLIMLVSATVTQSLVDAHPEAVGETLAAITTVGVLLVSMSAIAAWLFTGYLLEPVNSLRRDLSLAARSRALAEPVSGEGTELQALRWKLTAVLAELEAQNTASVSELRRILSLFEGISEGIIQIGPNGRFVHVNAAARRLLRLPQHPEGQTPASLIRNSELRESIERASRGEQGIPFEIVLDGRQLLVAPQVLPDGADQNGGAVITVVDLTELRRLESVRRDFVANVSHELKTPLTSIRGYAETLLTDELPRDRQIEFLQVIDKNATRIQRIVEDLLDLSRLQSGGWRPDLQDVDVAEIAADSWSTVRNAAVEKRIELELTGAPLSVKADVGGMRQVFCNLFENAVRYTNAGGSISLNLGADARRSGFNEIVVRDNGVGIPQDALSRIFERFYRVDTSRSRDDGGTGLGLSIVKHLVERMGGEVVAESELGKGTAIRLTLPATESNG